MMFWDGFFLGLVVGLLIGCVIVLLYKRSLYNKGIGKDPTREWLYGKLFYVVEEKTYVEMEQAHLREKTK